MVRSVGLDPDESLDVSEVIADDAYYDLLEGIAAGMENAFELPLRVGNVGNVVRNLALTQMDAMMMGATYHFVRDRCHPSRSLSVTGNVARVNP